MDLSARRPGPDVVRALAMAGVLVMNYRGYLILEGASRDGGTLDRFLDPWTGPLSTRFAATFVLTAGVGVTLMTHSSIGDPERTTQLRWRLARRGLLLYGAGIAFDQIWEGTILPFYGAMFLLAAVTFTLRSRWLVAIGTGAALAGWLIRWWRYERALDGHDTSWLTNPGPRSPRGLLFDVFVNGTHPLLPWLAFFCAGIVVGRFLATTWWRPATAAAGLALYAASTIVHTKAGDGRSAIVLSVGPFERGLLYTAGALGTALLAFAAVTWVANRFEHLLAIDVLRRAGQLSLTIYLAHALVFNLLVHWLGVVGPGGLATALVFAALVWAGSVALAAAYQRRYGRGPAERVYRALTN